MSTTVDGWSTLKHTPSKTQLSSARLSKKSTDKKAYNTAESSKGKQDINVLDSLKQKLSQNIGNDKKKQEEEKAEYSILRQSFEKLHSSPSKSRVIQPTTHVSSPSKSIPSQVKAVTIQQDRNTYQPNTARATDNIVPPLSFTSRTKEETDTFVKGFQYIERINKTRAKSAGLQRSLNTTRTSNPGFLSSRSTTTNNVMYSEKLTDWEDFENKREDDNGHHAVKASTHEPLRLQYDPSQIRMVPTGSENLKGGNNSKKAVIKDLKMMADACNRAGRLKMEGLIHYKIANKYEEMSDDKSAIPHYERFLEVNEALKDEMGQCLALNCLGVLHQRMGGTDNLNTALKYHMMQWDISDPQSQVVSNINMGLIFQKLGHNDSASDNFKMAYQQANKIGDTQGESIALANLGSLGKEQGDLATAQACIERHLTLSENLNNPVGEGEAYQQLGILASKQGDDYTAVKMLHKARSIATQYDKKKADQISVNIGIIEGNNRFEEFVKNLYNSSQ